MCIGDIAGFAAIIVVLFCYMQLARGVWGPRSISYLGGNIIGASLMIVSLMFDFNAAAFVLQLMMIAISIYGLLAERAKNIQPSDI